VQQCSCSTMGIQVAGTYCVHTMNLTIPHLVKISQSWSNLAGVRLPDRPVVSAGSAGSSGREMEFADGWLCAFSFVVCASSWALSKLGLSCMQSSSAASAAAPWAFKLLVPYDVHTMGLTIL
jgi:hypothetical protein